VATNQPKLVAAAVAVITVAMFNNAMLVESVVKVALEATVVAAAVAVMLVNVLDCHYSCYNSYFSDSCNCSYGSYCFN